MSKCAAGSRKVAALLAAWTTASGWSSLEPLHELAEALELLREELVTGLVRGREMGHDARHAVAEERAREPRVLRCRAVPCRCRA